MKITAFKKRFKELTPEEQAVTISKMEKGGKEYEDQDVYKAFLKLLDWCKLNKKE
jgi:hypothetical protein